MAARGSPLILTDAEVAWLKSLTLSDATSAAYRGEVGRLIAFCASSGVLEVHRLKAKHWAAYLSCLTTDRTAISPLAKPLKPASAVQAVRITRSFLLYCARRDWLSWDPADVEPPHFERPSPTETLAIEQLSDGLKSILRSASIPDDACQARRHLALGISFWGALTPREIASLRVDDLSLPSANGACELRCSGRPSPVVLPREISVLWQRYRQLREEDARKPLPPNSPLIANLKTGKSLQPWSVWALLRRTEAEESAGDVPNPRLMRKAYLAGATRNADQAINVVRAQCGKAIPAEAATEPDTQRSIMSKLQKSVRAKLQTEAADA